MDEEAKKKQELEELIALLEGIKGRHTELVTVMISAGFNVSAVVRQLEAERSTAANIKSKSTRDNVTGALDRIIRELKNYKQTPANGLAAFSGNIWEREGVGDMGLWPIEPFRPLNIKMFRWERNFV